MRIIILRPVIIPVGPSIAYVPLTRGSFALIDSWDAPMIGQRNWCQKVLGEKTYATTHTRSEGTIYMHRLLSGFPSGKVVDHKNGNGLDNRSQNRRAATRSQNAINSGPSRANSSGIRGVRRKRNKFVAFIMQDGCTVWCGTHPTEEQAQSARYAKSIELSGEFTPDSHLDVMHGFTDS